MPIAAKPTQRRVSSACNPTPAAFASAGSKSKNFHSGTERTAPPLCAPEGAAEIRAEVGSIDVRVLHLTTEFPPVIYGGLGTATGGLVKALVEAGVDAGVLLFGPTTGASYGECRPLAADEIAPRRRRAAGATIFEISWFLDLDTVTKIAAG